MTWLDRLTIRMKLILLTALAIVVAAVLVAINAYDTRDRMIEDRKGEIRSIVESAAGIAQALETEVQAGHLTQDAAVASFRQATQAMRYRPTKEYVLAYKMDGVSIAHGGNPAQVGSNRIAIKDANGKPIVGGFIDALRNADTAFYTYMYPRASGGEPLPKLTFVQRFRPWDMLIGSGVYTDDIEADFLGMMTRVGLVALVLLALLAGVAYLISRNISGAIGGLERKMGALAAGDLDVTIDETARGDEIGRMAAAVQVFKAASSMPSAGPRTRCSAKRRTCRAAPRRQAARPAASHPVRRRPRAMSRPWPPPPRNSPPRSPRSAAR
jgi:methyl-accepting chemotaxis protein